MTVHIQVECEACGKKVKPPENHGWIALNVTAPDGANLIDNRGHLCRECCLDLYTWITRQREAADKERARRPS